MKCEKCGFRNVDNVKDWQCPNCIPKAPKKPRRSELPPDNLVYIAPHVKKDKKASGKHNFEFVEFYPDQGKPRPPFIGTVHVYYVDKQVDLRGILISNKGKIRFHMPQGKTYDPELKKNVTYPFVTFTDVTIFPALLRFLEKEVKPLIEAYLNGKPKKIEEKG